jgi:hypothetical protein
MTSKHDVGSLGFGIVGGLPVEGQLFYNYVSGAFISASTTGSSQVTGTGDGTFLYDVSEGIVMIDGDPLAVARAADSALEAAADILDDGQTRIYTIIGWKNAIGGAVTLKVVKGTIALHAAAVAATTAEIEADLPLGAMWVALGTVAIARTADTTVTEVVSNLVRPTLVPTTVNRS